MSGNDLIFNFFSENDPKGLEVIKNIFFKIIGSPTYTLILNYYEKEDVFQEFLATKILPYRNHIVDKFFEQQSGLVSYIQRMTKNFLADVYASVKLMSENEISDVINSKEEDDEDEVKSYFDLIGKAENYILDIEAEEVKIALTKHLSDSEVLMFCYQISDSKEFYKSKYFNDLSDDALYKRVERMKTKIKEILKEYSFSAEAFEKFLKEHSHEICKKLEVNNHG
ncbi:MAG: hypothetical protein JHC31_15730 [Sulfurihydrogenibium sp.]|jgi:hypothetical protein|nr:hypothetical protein [Sulfurihydrogenibium sp.]